MGTRDEALGRIARRESTAGSQPGGAGSWVQDDTAAVRASLTLDQPASAQNIAGMRRALAGWLALDVAAGELLDDVVLVVYEALANVADHAYASAPDGVGAVRLTAHRAHGSLRITVADDGQWRVGTDSPFRSRGLLLIRMLIEQVYIETTGSGTSVHLRCGLPAPEPAP